MNHFALGRMALATALGWSWSQVPGAVPLRTPSDPHRRQRETVVLPKSVPDPIEPVNRIVYSFNKGLMTGRGQADRQSLSAHRHQTGQDGDWEFWQEHHVSRTADQQPASGKVGRGTR